MDSIGAYLRRERELRHLSLEELVQITRIPLRMLQRIEDDKFDELPGEVFARGFLRAYARAVGLSSDAVLGRYGEGRKVEEPSPAPLLSSIQTPERGRRFGIAIALVILLIIFTLALSIVLRPRHRDTPLELSKASNPVLDHVDVVVDGDGDGDESLSRTSPNFARNHAFIVAVAVADNDQVNVEMVDSDLLV